MGSELRKAVLIVGVGAGSSHAKAWFNSVREAVAETGLALIGVDFDGQYSQSTALEGLAHMTLLDGDYERVVGAGRVAYLAAEIGDHWAPQAVLAVRENYQRLAADLALSYGLRANRPDVVDLIQDKFACRQRLRQAGIYQPLSLDVGPGATGKSLASRASRAAAESPLSVCGWILKPRSGMGSNGVRAFDAAHDLKRVEPTVIDQDYLLEQRVWGAEFSIEGIVCDSRAEFYGITSKSINESFVETGHVHTGDLSDNLSTRVQDEVRRAIKAVDLEWGLFHIEYWITADDEIVLGELHCRAGGDFIHCLVELSRPGFKVFADLMEVLLHGHSMGIAPSVAISGSRFVQAPSGTVLDIVMPDHYLDEVVEVIQDAHVGQFITPANGDYGRAASIVARGQTAEEVQRVLSLVEESVLVVVG